jgi:hypothetical protein
MSRRGWQASGDQAFPAGEGIGMPTKEGRVFRRGRIVPASKEMVVEIIGGGSRGHAAGVQAEG